VRSPEIVRALQRIAADEDFGEASEICLQQQVINGALTRVIVVVVGQSEEREAKLRHIAASEGLELAGTGPSMTDRYTLTQPDSEAR
jgi:hypothetical protein